jgi:YVTN family beta-propeller protein
MQRSLSVPALNHRIKLAEIAVGHEPHCVAVHPTWREAYVTNAVSGTVSVVAFEDDVIQVVDEIPVGTEPRGCAITPNGTQLYVANHTAGTVSVIDLAKRQVIKTVVLPLVAQWCFYDTRVQDQGLSFLSFPPISLLMVPIALSW